ncbi:MAG: cell wall-binding repeat-containing protein [Bacillota bacterium]|nr:cell wall-binding repeat-containing protein [Bacillota bacterium]
MLKKRNFLLTLSLSIVTLISSSTYLPIVQAADNSTAKKIYRLQGANRFQTSTAIAKQVNDSTTLENVVLTSGYDFPDGLSGSTLAKQLNAPLLMAGNLSDSQEAFSYISTHLKQNGNVYILGGTSAVGQDTEDALKLKGYTVNRIWGKDRIGTNCSVIDNLNVQEGTPVFIANAYGFADALSASSVASINGYPILLTDSASMSSSITEKLSKIKPSAVYIAGGTGVVSNSIEDSIKTLLPSSTVKRLSGNNRYDTSMAIFNFFNLNTNNIILASGKDFPDALCGSQLAASLNCSMVLADENNLYAQQSQYYKKSIQNFYLLGGTGAISTNVDSAINFDELAEISQIKAAYTSLDQSIVTKDISKLLPLVDPNSAFYAAAQNYISLLNSNTGNTITSCTSDSFDFTFTDSTNASVGSVENIVYVNNKTSQITTKKLSLVTNIKKIDGKWYIENITIKLQ